MALHLEQMQVYFIIPNTNVLTVATITPTTVNATNVNVSGAIANSTNEVTILSNVKLPAQHK